MRRITREEHAAAVVALGQQQMRDPRIGDEDLPRTKRSADPGVEDRIGIDRCRIDSGRRPRVCRVQVSLSSCAIKVPLSV